MKRIYLDYAASAPLRESAKLAMLPWLGGAHNPSSIHTEGRQAREALDVAREVFARALGVRAREVFFCASGSEAVSWALLGAQRALGPTGRIISAKTEHRAVLATVAAIEECGWKSVLLGIDSAGRIDLAELEEALSTARPGEAQLVSLMLVNNELGTLTDLPAVVTLARRFGALVHCDAIGAGALVAVAPIAALVDSLSLAAHKFGGPLGCGVLIARETWPLTPLIFGGGQEFGRRAGTENLAAVVGAAAAFREVEAQRAQDAATVASLRASFEAQVCEALPTAFVHAQHAVRAPGISLIAIPELELEVLPVALDLAGVAVSVGSACASGALKRSHVLQAIGYHQGAALRFSWGAAVSADATRQAAERFIAAVQAAQAPNRTTAYLEE